MLDFPIEGVPRSVLYGLLLLWAALLVFGFVFGRPDAAQRNRLPLLARMAMSVVLVISALVWWRAGTVGTALAAFGLFLFLGMAFGFLGDLFMARVIPVPEHVIFGILAFGVGHVFYILAFLQAGRVLGLEKGQTRLIMVLIYLAAALILWVWLVRSPSEPAVMNYGTLGYSLLLCVMAGLAMALVVQEGSLLPLALGGLFFIVSDLILGNELMRHNSWPLIGDVIWITYTVAQMLIVFSSSAALRLLGA